MANHLRTRILIASGAFLLSLALLIWIFDARSRQGSSPVIQTTGAPPATAPHTGTASSPPPIPSSTVAIEAVPQATPAAPGAGVSTPTSVQPEESQTPSTSQPTPLISPAAPFGSAQLLIPVAGVRPEQLRDTFQDARSEGRVHDAIDIPAASGTPVLAAADGRIVKLFYSDKGGITIYQLSADEKLVYYYAHLARYADGISEGHYARRGELLAFVGDTGNAGHGNYHLHFSVAILSDPKRYWAGTNINPYPLLRATK